MNYLGWTSLRHELGTMNCPVAALERHAKARAFVLSLLAQKHASKRACPLGWRLQQASGKPENGKSRCARVLCDFYDLVHCESPTPPLKSDEIATKKKGFKRTSNFLTLAYLITNTCATYLHTNFREKEIKFSRIFRLLWFCQKNSSNWLGDLHC